MTQVNEKSITQEHLCVKNLGINRGLNHCINLISMRQSSHDKHHNNDDNDNQTATDVLSSVTVQFEVLA